MKISKYRFEEELDSLINAAFGSSSKETAKDYLKKAYSKADGYDDIPLSLVITYKSKVESAAAQLGIDL